ncbi:MAG: ABC transporter permease [Defluviitaleaceae bacterium]|nr:ABC transporter permease [Defluviitaleaceae bacterium]
MAAFYASYRNELNKLLWRRKYKVFLILGIGFCFLWAVLGNLAAGLIARGGFVVNLTPAPMGVLPFYLQLMLPLLIFMGAGDLITAEGGNGTMRSMLFRPIERYKLFAAKHLAILTYVGIFLVSIFIISAGLYQIFGRGASPGGFFAALASYALTLPPLAVLAAFALFIALFGRSTTLIMLILIASYIAMSVLPIFIPILSELLFTSYLGWHRIWVGAMPPLGRVLHMVIVLAGYGVVFFTAGSIVFDKKEY